MTAYKSPAKQRLRGFHDSAFRAACIRYYRAIRKTAGYGFEEREGA